MKSAQGYGRRYVIPGIAVRTAALALLFLTPRLQDTTLAQCVPEWSDRFGDAGFDDFVTDLIAWDDGAGPTVYASGYFMGKVRKWNGHSWDSVGGGASSSTSIGYIQALGAFDSGNGSELYVGGDFNRIGNQNIRNLARWNGTSWSAVGVNFAGDPRDMLVFDFGDGPNLYVSGGGLMSANGMPLHGTGCWDGAAWSPLGMGINSARYAYCLEVYDDGNGPALYAGGNFVAADGAPADLIMKWTGTTWVPVGGGITGTDVLDMQVYDDGTGPALYVSGSFSHAGGVPASQTARWNGVAWSAVGAGLPGYVDALEIFDDGAGPKLYAGGGFNSAAGQRVSKWDGVSWSAVGVTGMNSSVFALKAFDEPGGSRLVAGGAFTSITNSRPALRIAAWDNTSWSHFGGQGLNDTVYTLAMVDAGNGPALHVGGDFSIAGDISASKLGVWNGANWSTFGSGFLGSSGRGVRAIAVFTDASGQSLFAGGDFTSVGGAAGTANIVRWDVDHWAPVGAGLNGRVAALLVSSVDGEPALYAGGSFTMSGTQPVTRVARWTGSAWLPLGDGVDSFVTALAEFDDGSGPALYAAGNFVNAGGGPANRIAKWNGSTWAALGSGLSGIAGALQIFDADGDGPAPASLYVGGSFISAGGATVNRIARWDGTIWWPLAGGTSGTVSALTIFDDDGDGPNSAELVAGGSFEIAGVASPNIARWNGAAWQGVAGGCTGIVQTLATFDEDGPGPSPPALYVGGDIFSAGGHNATHLTRFGCELVDCPGDLNGDRSVGLSDLTILLANFGTPGGASPGQGDIDSDDDVDLGDLTQLLAAFGEMCR